MHKFSDMEQIDNSVVRVILTDDHKIVRDGIRAMLQGDSAIAIVGEASNGDELVQLLTTTTADVVLLDINMPGKSGFDITCELKLKYPDVKVLILSMLDNERYASKALENGAVGYIIKNVGKEELAFALRLVAKGITYISPSISLSLLTGKHSDAPMPAEDNLKAQHELTKRELEVLQLIAEGYTNADIAEKLFNSKRTIETHRQNLLEKTNCRNTASLIKYAMQKGII